MNTQNTRMKELIKESTESLQHYFNSKKWTNEIRKGKWTNRLGIKLNQQIGYQQGFKEALTIAVNLMFNECYQDIGSKPFNLIEKILKDNDYRLINNITKNDLQKIEYEKSS